tara:strand:- start:90 stop:1127 length:1038 start_codon:yes stop_codon:yes gene_type:complete
MIANLHNFQFFTAYGNWGIAYNHLINALSSLGYEVCIDRNFKIENISSNISNSYIRTDKAVNIYNHTYPDDLRVQGKNLDESILNIFIKPTGPSTQYFSLDTLGFGPCSSLLFKQEYNILDIEILNNFYRSEVQPLIHFNTNKWSFSTSDSKFKFNEELEVDIPENHVLVLGQMPGDTTVTDMQFGDHWEKLKAIVDYLHKRNFSTVVKLHPTLRDKKSEEEWEDTKYGQQVLRWKSAGIVVLDDYSSIHKVLPKASVAVVENSTSGIEAIMHNIPVISYGNPEYKWATKPLEHLCFLEDYIKDLSWYSTQRSYSWLYYYLKEYLCSNLDSTIRRLNHIFNEYTI